MDWWIEGEGGKQKKKKRNNKKKKQLALQQDRDLPILL